MGDRDHSDGVGKGMVKRQRSSGKKKKRSQKRVSPATVFRELPDEERLVVEILAVQVAPCGIMKLVECLQAVDSAGRILITANPQERKRILEGLELKKLVSRTPRGISCVERLRAHVILELLRQDRYRQLADTVRQQLPIPCTAYIGIREFRSHEQVLRELQYACYGRNSVKDVLDLVGEAGNFLYPDSLELDAFQEILPPETARELAGFLGPEVKALLYANILMWRLYDFGTVDPVYFCLACDFLQAPEHAKVNVAPLVSVLLLRGNCAEAQACIENCSWSDEQERLAARGRLLFQQGKQGAALDAFDRALALYKKENRKRKASLPGFSGLFHILALVGEGSEVSLEEAFDHVKRLVRLKDDQSCILQYWLSLIRRELGMVEALDEITASAFAALSFVYSVHALEHILTFFPLIWLDAKILREGETVFLELLQRARDAKLFWPAALCA
jgi:tetratricopeptide (TPR) repeat protein